MFEGESYWIAKLIFQKGLALTYFVAFTVALKQYTGLVGEKGILPIEELVREKDLREVLSLFYFFNSDFIIKLAASSGVILSLVGLFGFGDVLGNFSYVAVWGSMWLLFLSFKNTGQIFYYSGSSLNEAGFLAIFLGPSGLAVPSLLVLLMRWFLFRMMFGAGLIKFRRGDEKWKNLTALDYFYKIQSCPNPLSKLFHKLPTLIKKLGVLFNHFTLLVVPFLFFLPQPYASIAGGFTVAHQILIVLSGNFYWLNLLTVAATAFTFSDQVIMNIFSISRNLTTTPYSNEGLIVILAGLIAVRSIPATHRMFLKSDFNSRSYSILRLVNTYGRYSVVYEQKKEVIIKGLKDGEWREYEFYGKTSKLNPPRFIAPYVHRLDSVLWFAAHKPEKKRELIKRILQSLSRGSEPVEKLFKKVPFEEPPEKIKAEVYEYEFNDKENGDYWKREKLEEIEQL